MLTIVIPTKNRPKFIIRVLKYYISVNFKHKILIGDSSDPAQLDETKDFITKTKNKLKVEFLEYPDSNVIDCLKSLIEKVESPYTAFCPDDDFLISRSLDRCIEFLENNPSYIAAQGQALIFTLNSPGAFGKVEDITPYPLSNIEGDSGRERLLNFLSSYISTVFAVYRTQIWKLILKQVSTELDKTFMGEIFPSALSVILGRIKKIDLLYLIRQHHDKRYFLPDFYDWITSSQWQPSYQIFTKTLKFFLADRDNINLEESAAICKQAFWSYLGKIEKRYKSYYKENQCKLSLLNRIKARTKRNPSINNFVPVWRKVRDSKYWLFPSSKMSLYSLLSPRSPYYKDFLQAYKVITNSK